MRSTRGWRMLARIIVGRSNANCRETAGCAGHPTPVLIHQPLISGRMIGPASDINIQAKEMEKLRKELNQILATSSGQPMERIDKDTDRDFYLNAQEAIDYGLADRIVDKV